MKELLPWISLGVVVLGFIGQGMFGSFRLGQAVEQMKATVKEQIDEERDKIISKIDELEARFADEQKIQDHNFGEVNAAVRQYTADVEKKLREVEIYGRDHYVQKPDFEKAIDKLSAEIKAGNADLKADLKDDLNELKAQIVAVRN